MKDDAAADSERAAWNKWNAENRESDQSRSSQNQAAIIERWIGNELSMPRSLRLLEVGCGTGWMCERLTQFGSVTGVDLADEVLSRARQRRPDITYIAGDFLNMELPAESFDVIVSMETMAHFVDQEGFLRRVHSLLRPGGSFMLATQNRPMMEKNIEFLPNGGWHRHWVDHAELRSLLQGDFRIEELSSTTPTFFKGPLHWINSRKMEMAASKVGMARPLARIKRAEEDRFMGWTLMCLAVKSSSAEPAG